MNRRDVLKAGVGVLLGIPLLRRCCPKPDRPQPRVYVWRGLGHDWQDPTNWEPRGVPGDGDSIECPAGSVCRWADERVGPCLASVTIREGATFEFASGEIGIVEIRT